MIALVADVKLTPLEQYDAVFSLWNREDSSTHPVYEVCSDSLWEPCATISLIRREQTTIWRLLLPPPQLKYDKFPASKHDKKSA